MENTKMPEIILLEILDITKKNLPERHPDFFNCTE